MVKDKDMQFCMENLKMKRKGPNFFWPSRAGIWTPDFLIFQPMIWIFTEGKDDGIKYKQPSKISLL